MRSTAMGRLLSMVVDTSLDSKPLTVLMSMKAVPPGAKDTGIVRVVPWPLSNVSTTLAALTSSGLASDSFVAKNGPVAPSAR